MGDLVAFEGALEAVVEILECLAGWEPGGTDAAFAAVVLACCDLAFQTGGQELFVRPALGAGPVGEPVDRAGQRGCLQGPAQVSDVGGRLGGHHATPRARS